MLPQTHATCAWPRSERDLICICIYKIFVFMLPSSNISTPSLLNLLYENYQLLSLHHHHHHDVVVAIEVRCTVNKRSAKHWQIGGGEVEEAYDIYDDPSSS